jgi:hypothetical protein
MPLKKKSSTATRMRRAPARTEPRSYEVKDNGAPGRRTYQVKANGAQGRRSSFAPSPAWWRGLG